MLRFWFEKAIVNIFIKYVYTIDAEFSSRLLPLATISMHYGLLIHYTLLVLNFRCLDQQAVYIMMLATNIIIMATDDTLQAFS